MAEDVEARARRGEGGGGVEGLAGGPREMGAGVLGAEVDRVGRDILRSDVLGERENVQPQRSRDRSVLFSLSRLRSSDAGLVGASLDSTRLRNERSDWNTKNERERATCSSKYASGSEQCFCDMMRHKASTDESVYPSAECSKILSGRWQSERVAEPSENGAVGTTGPRTPRFKKSTSARS